jgi:hypothetical protein
MRLEQHDGRVTGVLAKTRGQLMRFQADGGVVLATGYFSGNAEMKAHYLSAEAARADAVNSGNTGWPPAG